MIDNTKLLVTTEDENSTGIESTPASEPDTLVEDELLVEDVSIDGMCGVY